MKLSLTEIPQKELNEFIRLIDGFCGIFSEDRSWMIDKDCKPYKITLYCYLISTGSLYVENQKLKSFDGGHEKLIDFIEEFFRGKCIVNFTDMLFLNEINQSFCGGTWDNVHLSWLAYRPELLAEIANRNFRIIRGEQAYQITVENAESDFGDLYFILVTSEKTTLVDYFEGSITWRKEPISIAGFKRMFNVGSKDYTVQTISKDEFIEYLMDIVQDEAEVGSLLN